MLLPSRSHSRQNTMIKSSRCHTTVGEPIMGHPEVFTGNVASGSYSRTERTVTGNVPLIVSTWLTRWHVEILLPRLHVEHQSMPDVEGVRCPVFGRIMGFGEEYRKPNHLEPGVPSHDPSCGQTSGCCTCGIYCSLESHLWLLASPHPERTNWAPSSMGSLSLKSASLICKCFKPPSSVPKAISDKAVKKTTHAMKCSLSSCSCPALTELYGGTQ
ncbi:uncharacterized protein LOC119855743 [Dermochelys coriacea]|uniref:uncharacterized protein LOC119855743 n=1 Tax=Dermochelys coriacea TaxID=27794 RepID=UPI001CA83007|nr:uncharacterized protein LOC119855743 [Dermochelys coriacea]